MKIKGYIIKDTQENIVIFDYLTLVKFKSSGVISEVKGEVKVKDFNDLVKLNLKENVIGAQHKESGEIISHVEYLNKEKELLSFRRYDDVEEMYIWNSLDDEFNYRKFVASYQHLREKVYEEEEILVEVVKEVLIDTGNPFISSKFSNSGELSNICTYHRSSALMSIAEEKLKELGAERLPDQTFGSNTDGKLAYSIPTHSGIKFLKFAGSYIFTGSSFEGNNLIKVGELETLLEYYKEDEQAVRNIIQNKYLEKFGRFDESKTLVISESIKKLSNLESNIRKLNVNKKSSNDHRICIGEANKIKGLLLTCLEIRENGN